MEWIVTIALAALFISHIRLIRSVEELKTSLAALLAEERVNNRRSAEALQAAEARLLRAIDDAMELGGGQDALSNAMLAGINNLMSYEGAANGSAK